VRRWSVDALRVAEPGWDASEALAVTALVHIGADAAALDVAMRTCRPRLVLFLDEPAWQRANWSITARAHHIRDPHRDGQVYEGFWGRRDDGTIVGKAPQHPTMHRFYRPSEMSHFLKEWTV
jgi:hypothetical protein